MAVSLYEVLGVPPDADADTLRAQYRALVKHYHPDAAGNRGNDAVAELFREVQEAYEVLSDAAERARYDAARKILEPPPEPEGDNQYYPSPTSLFFSTSAFHSGSLNIHSASALVFPMTGSAWSPCVVGQSASFVWRISP